MDAGACGGPGGRCRNAKPIQGLSASPFARKLWSDFVKYKVLGHLRDPVRGMFGGTMLKIYLTQVQGSRHKGRSDYTRLLARWSHGVADGHTLDAFMRCWSAATRGLAAPTPAAERAAPAPPRAARLALPWVRTLSPEARKTLLWHLARPPPPRAPGGARGPSPFLGAIVFVKLTAPGPRARACASARVHVLACRSRKSQRAWPSNPARTV